jgi:hypothetical protein
MTKHEEMALGEAANGVFAGTVDSVPSGERERRALVDALDACPRDRGGRRVYSSALKEQLTQYILSRIAAGTGTTLIGAELGVAQSQVQRWLERASALAGHREGAPEALEGMDGPGGRQVSPHGEGVGVPESEKSLHWQAGRSESESEGSEGAGKGGGFLEVAVVRDQDPGEAVRPRGKSQESGKLIAISPTGWRLEGLTLSAAAILFNGRGL